jgi:amino acid transporter
MELGSPVSDDEELGKGSRTSNHHVDFTHSSGPTAGVLSEGVELTSDPSDNRDVKAIRRGSFSKLEEELGNTEDPLSKKDAKEDLHLGTFRGVILPCLQSNMLGAILFIRLPWIVGEVGILQSTVIVFLSAISVLLTSTSLSAIVTNGKLSKTGSLYYVLRKNIGLELGGSVGVMYTIGKLLACAMYCLGAAEAFMLAIDQHGSFKWDTTAIAIAIATFICFSTALQQSNLWFDRSSNLLLGIAALGFLSFLVGGCAFAARDYYGDLHQRDRIDMDNIASDPQYDSHIDRSVNFYFLLGLYYPSVSGIMGASTWSGSLENPGRSIPKGTMLATLITFLVSIMIIYLFGYTVSNEELLENKLVLASLAWPVSGLGYFCIVCALWGAASQSLHGIIRSIGAIAKDGAVPFFYYFNEPRVDAARLKLRQIVVSWVLICIACLAQHLDHIAPITATFYLVVYAALNAACFLHSVTKSPGFRPHFKYFR